MHHRDSMIGTPILKEGIALFILGHLLFFILPEKLVRIGLSL
jgi:hypothetical protein